MKFPILFVVGVLCLLNRVSHAQMETNTRDLLSRAMNNMSQIRKVMLCLARSCDTGAVAKAMAIDDASEFMLRQKPYEMESNFDRVLKFAAGVSAALPKFLAIDPNCNDHLYICPKKREKKPVIPSEVYEMAEYVELMVAASKCITTENLEDAINVIGEGIVYIENNGDSSGTATERFVPALELVTMRLKEMCQPMKHLIPAEPSQSGDDKEGDNAGNGKKVMVLIPSKVLNKNAQMMWLKKS
uniref:Secreted protein n=1 Tax=Musca domestica TaxID=7370 RepID=A0A1I8MD29_MUSDO